TAHVADHAGRLLRGVVRVLTQGRSRTDLLLELRYHFLDRPPEPLRHRVGLPLVPFLLARRDFRIGHFGLLLLAPIRRGSLSPAPGAERCRRRSASRFPWPQPRQWT